MKKTIGLVLFSVLAFSTMAQKQQSKLPENSTHYNMNRMVSLEEDSEAKEVTIDVGGDVDFLNVSISSNVSTGKIVIELFDPANKKQGNFSVETLASAKHDHATGHFEKKLKEPLVGSWKIKIIPTKANGNIQIHTDLSK